jgi:aminoglycoside phosphotransferase (APT) family kinase protein
LSAQGDALTARVQAAAQAWRPGAEVVSFEQLAGGASGLTYRAELVSPAGDGVPVVVKVAPAGLAPVRNRDVLRQARVLRALHGRPGIAVAEVLFDDPGDPGPSDRPPLFATTFVDGESFEPIIDPRDGDLPSADVIEGRAVAAARMLAALHAVDPTEAGLDGEPVNGLTDELDRWTASFETVEDELRPRWLELREALVAGLPDPRRPAVVHGDYRLGNMLCSGDEVQAIIDWEIWALTDPRIDLAWMLMFCHRREQPPAVRDAPGMPDAVTLRRVYEEAAGVPVDAPEWFDAFVRFKQAATIALLVKRRRKAAVERGDDPGPVSPTPRLLITRGLELLGVPTG